MDVAWGQQGITCPNTVLWLEHSIECTGDSTWNSLVPSLRVEVGWLTILPPPMVNQPVMACFTAFISLTEHPITKIVAMQLVRFLWRRPLLTGGNIQKFHSAGLGTCADLLLYCIW